MGTEANKKKLYAGLSPRDARNRLIEIWIAKNPGKLFESVHGNVWPWMEAWHKLRMGNWTVDVMIQAFAEKIAASNNQKRALEHKLAEQKKAITILGEVISEQRGIIAGLTPAAIEGGGKGATAAARNTKEYLDDPETWRGI